MKRAWPAREELGCLTQQRGGPRQDGAEALGWVLLQVLSPGKYGAKSARLGDNTQGLIGPLFLWGSFQETEPSDRKEMKSIIEI